jgi:esterase/lipase
MIKNFIEQFLFFPSKDLNKTPLHINIPYTNIYINNNDDVYHGWFIESENKNTVTNGMCILFIHGNAGNISYRLNYIQKFHELGFSIMVFDYPGFGLSTGIPNEESCIECSHLFYKYIIENYNILKSNIIIYGESIGGSIAASLSNICSPKYLILQSTFTDIKLIVKKIIHIDLFLINIIGFETLEKIKYRYKLNKLNKKMKTYIIHSSDDEIINFHHGEELSKYADKYYLCSGSHSNVNIDSDFIFNLLSFIKIEN